MVDRERIYRTEAIILRRTNFGEADRLMTLYTPYMGKVRAIAKGVRKPTSRKRGHVELFMRSQLLLARGRNLDIITQAEAIDTYLPLRTDLWRMTYACYAAELLDAFTAEEEENYALYKLLADVLTWTCEETDLDRAIRFYELQLLGLVGFRPQLFSCVRCQAEIQPETNHFSAGEGGVLCPRCGAVQAGVEPVSLNALKILRYFQANDYAICRTVRISRKSHREIERMMQRYIVFHLERKLKSTEFLQLLRRHRPGSA